MGMNEKVTNGNLEQPTTSTSGNNPSFPAEVIFFFRYIIHFLFLFELWCDDDRHQGQHVNFMMAMQKFDW